MYIYSIHTTYTGILCIHMMYDKYRACIGTYLTLLYTHTIYRRVQYMYKYDYVHIKRYCIQLTFEVL